MQWNANPADWNSQPFIQHNPFQEQLWTTPVERHLNYMPSPASVALDDNDPWAAAMRQVMPHTMHTPFWSYTAPVPKKPISSQTATLDQPLQNPEKYHLDRPTKSLRGDFSW